MEVSIEVYFLTNLAMDALALAAAARIRGRARPRAVLGAAALGALYATLAQLPGCKSLGQPWVLACVGTLLAALALPPSGRGGILAGALTLAAGTLFLGGAQLCLARSLPPLPALALGALLGGAALVGLGRARARRLSTWDVAVYAATVYGEARFAALVDTGNRLREPLSGLPVLIAEEALLRPLLPPDFSAESAGPLPAGFRWAAYGALGGSGRLACFLPRTLMVDAGKGFRPAPEAYIAVYPGQMTGSVRALAPPSLGNFVPVGRRNI